MEQQGGLQGREKTDGAAVAASTPAVDSKEQPVGYKAGGQFRERSVQQLLTVLFLSAIVAWLMSVSSQHMWVNLPAAVALVASVRWLLQQHEARVRASLAGRGWRQSRAAPGGAVHVTAHAHHAHSRSTSNLDAKGRDSRWREKVGSDLVAEAWEIFCGSILQEFVYDLWWGSLTPDREFPREIRRVLHGAFGELAARARQADLRSVLLWEVSELVVAQIRLLRETRASIVGDDEDAWAMLPMHARDRALANELRAEKKLHAALYPPAPDANVALGHYAVLHQLGQGMVNCLMDKNDAAKPMMRAAAHELLVSCVLRPVLHLFTPYNIHKGLLAAMQKRVAKRQVSLDEAAAEAAAAIAANDLTRNEKGTWEFRQRLQHSAAMEHATAHPLPRRASKPLAADASPRRTHSGMRSARSVTPPPVRGSEWLRVPPAMSSPLEGPASPFRRSGSDSNLQRVASFGEASHAASMHFHERKTADVPSTLSSHSSLRGSPRRDRGPEEARRHMRRRTDPNSPSARARAGFQEPHKSLSARSSGSAELDPLSQPASGPLPGARPSERDRLASCTLVPGSNSTRSAFVGQPKAQVVVAEMAAESGREVVVYKIRVADATGEWTVSRRFRSFESLHRALRDQLGPSMYSLKLPAKRIFNHGIGVAFVEERRMGLNTYLAQILSDPVLYGHLEVWEFLSESSEAYGPASEVGFFKGLVRDANTSVRHAVGDMVDNIDTTRRKILSNVPTVTLPDAPWGRLGGGMAGDGLPRRSSFSNSNMAVRQNSQGLPQAAREQQGAAWLTNEPREQNGGIRSMPASRAASGSLVGQAMPPSASQPASRGSPTESVQGFRGSILHYTRIQQPSPGKEAAGSEASRPSPPGEAASAGSAAHALGRADSAPSTPAASAPPSPGPRASEGGVRLRHRHSASAPQEPGHMLAPATAPPRPSEDVPPPVASAGPDRDADAIANHGPNPLPASVADPPAPPSEGSPAAAAALAWEEESAGISEPLYGIIDELFRMQGRGFIRPLVYSWGRQLLSLFAGGAIDDYVLSQLRLLRQEHFLARKILQLQAFLWPGGTWFMAAAWHAAPAAQPAPHKAAMTPEAFLDFSGPQPIDADEIREAVERLLLSGAPPAITRVVGRAAYESGMRDALDMLQSQTFVMQLAYGLLEIILGNLFPELEPLLVQARHGPPS